LGNTKQVLEPARYRNYLKEISALIHRGDAREESYYPLLAGLLNEWAVQSGRSKIQITVQPRGTDAGNPDFRIWDGRQHIVGYIEAKSPTIDNLDRIEESEQFTRYRDTFPNLILTNFLEFRLYRQGKLVKKALLGRPFAAHRLRLVPPLEQPEELNLLLEQFFAFSLPRVLDAETLARELARRTRFLRDEVIARQLQQELADQTGTLAGFYEAFRQYLITTLTPEDFADLYAQTITYGLFAARTRTTGEFNRRLAYDNIPHTIGILRDIFRYISLEDLPEPMEWIIDDIAEVLSVTDVKNILHQYFHEGRGSDPVVHFYETFLAVYDPETRERRGVYYTPEPVVSYIVRSVNKILKDRFNRQEGLANSSVTVLDPAAGTLTFLAEAAKLAVKEFTARYGEGAQENFIREHILENFYAFELMMAPYAVGHLKMAFLLEELGYRLKPDERVKLYLTNTLEMETLPETRLPGMASLSTESRLAVRVKRETPILVIIGNPPYSGISANMKPEMVNFLKEDRDGVQSYYHVDGEPLKERKVWLQDDYVKFIRFAQWKISQAGEGVVGFITNHSYLDNPTFRGMRQSLMKTFNEIYILDLHGNSLKKERCPDGSKDENVFDIRQGVAIALMVKYRNGTTACRVHHSEIWGTRDRKYGWLMKNDIDKTSWRDVAPVKPYYLFVPMRGKGKIEYESFYQVTSIFPVNVTGIVTARDHFVIDFELQPLKARIMTFLNKDLSDAIIKKGLELTENYMWRVSRARQELMRVENWEKYFTKILYRPFDVRYIYYHKSVVWRPREEVMRHMMQENLGLITRRQMLPTHPCNYVFITEHMISDGVIRSDNKGCESLFPLYLYPDTGRDELFPVRRRSGVRPEPNIAPEIFDRLRSAYNRSPAPEDILYYTYAVLYSDIYRQKYAEFLKFDFPRIPFTRSYPLFRRLAQLGRRLADLHLLKSAELDPPAVRFQGRGTNLIEKVRYEDRQVFINAGKFFAPVPPEVWSYQIGGYQVCAKWLKDRTGRQLTTEEIRHYCGIVTAIKKTVEIQRQIDRLYPQVEAELLPSD